MIVSRTARVLFVHVQKTGGSTIDSVLLRELRGATRVADLKGGRHARLDEALAAHPEFSDYWVFGFVRNPWARMYSWYSMIERRGQEAAAGDRRRIAQIARNQFWRRVLADYPSFETFVMKGVDDIARLGTPQIDYLRTSERTADFIGRTETLDEDMRAVCERLDIPPATAEPRLNAGPPADYQVHYTPPMRDKVEKAFAADIDEFGYEFGAPRTTDLEISGTDA